MYKLLTLIQLLFIPFLSFSQKTVVHAPNNQSISTFQLFEAKNEALIFHVSYDKGLAKGSLTFGLPQLSQLNLLHCKSEYTSTSTLNLYNSSAYKVNNYRIVTLPNSSSIIVFSTENGRLGISKSTNDDELNRSEVIHNIRINQFYKCAVFSDTLWILAKTSNGYESLSCPISSLANISRSQIPNISSIPTIDQKSERFVYTCNLISKHPHIQCVNPFEEAISPSFYFLINNQRTVGFKDEGHFELINPNNKTTISEELISISSTNGKYIVTLSKDHSSFSIRLFNSELEEVGHSKIQTEGVIITNLYSDENNGVLVTGTISMNDDSQKQNGIYIRLSENDLKSNLSIH